VDDEAQLQAIVEREIRYNRSVRTGEDTFWLEVELLHLLPSRIQQYDWTERDGQSAWLKFVEEGLVRTETSRDLFVEVYRRVFPTL